MALTLPATHSCNRFCSVHRCRPGTDRGARRLRAERIVTGGIARWRTVPDATCRASEGATGVAAARADRDRGRGPGAGLEGSRSAGPRDRAFCSSASTTKARWRARAHLCSRSIRPRSRSRWRRPGRSSRRSARATSRRTAKRDASSSWPPRKRSARRNTTMRPPPSSCRMPRCRRPSQRAPGGAQPLLHTGHGAGGRRNRAHAPLRGQPDHRGPGQQPADHDQPGQPDLGALQPVGIRAGQSAGRTAFPEARHRSAG